MSDNLTFADLLRARDAVFPPLYYATSEEVERGKILLAQKTEHSPEYIVFHPDDLEDVRGGITGRSLVHLRDIPRWMNTIHLTRAAFDALPIHRTPPGKKVAMRWRVESGGKWFMAEYVDRKGYVEVLILEIAVFEEPGEEL